MIPVNKLALQPGKSPFKMISSVKQAVLIYHLIEKFFVKFTYQCFYESLCFSALLKY